MFQIVPASTTTKENPSFFGNLARAANQGVQDMGMVKGLQNQEQHIANQADYNKQSFDLQKKIADMTMEEKMAAKAMLEKEQLKRDLITQFIAENANGTADPSVAGAVSEFGLPANTGVSRMDENQAIGKFAQMAQSKGLSYSPEEMKPIASLFTKKQPDSPVRLGQGDMLIDPVTGKQVAANPAAPRERLPNTAIVNTPDGQILIDSTTGNEIKRFAGKPTNDRESVDPFFRIASQAYSSDPTKSMLPPDQYAAGIQTLANTLRAAAQGGTSTTPNPQVNPAAGGQQPPPPPAAKPQPQQPQPAGVGYPEGAVRDGDKIIVPDSQSPTGWKQYVPPSQARPMFNGKPVYGGKAYAPDPNNPTSYIGTELPIQPISDERKTINGVVYMRNPQNPSQWIPEK